MNYTQSVLKNQTLKKVDFIWVNRDIGNVSWFRNILDEFEAEQESYLASTTPQERTNSREQDQDILIFIFIVHQYVVMNKLYMHRQLRTPTHVGRSLWKLLFAKFKAENRLTNVFFTGIRMVADEIKKHSDEYTFRFQHEPYC
ncbi:unnamed protein product [Adineta steineri]|uniref:Ferric reductase NAD binding domain-containing protein n=1 Tax=Adineta steineri TaxID=433720 RepID=A0A820GLF5_9BILA|nr:unnamed protein product [Adineta steineri]